VEPGSVAEALGLRKSDILLEIDGQKLASPESAKGRITRDSKVALLRKGRRETIGGRKDF
jgi:S1-C subfamily serine protease